jgi:hypothetical protein
MMIPEIEADLVAIARDEALLEEQRFVPHDAYVPPEAPTI